MSSRPPWKWVVLTPAELQEKLNRVEPVVPKLKQFVEKEFAKPYDACMGLMFVLAAECKAFDWDPRMFFKYVEHMFEKELLEPALGEVLPVEAFKPKAGS